MNYKAHSLFTVLFLLISFNLNANSDEEHHDNHAAHVHGLADLTIAIENNELEMQLESPAMNLLGFEHRAESEQDIKIVNDVEALLNSPEQLFSFEGTQCKHKEINVDTSGVLNDDEHDEQEHHAHSEHKHTEEHHSEEEHENHSEVIASYHFSCDKIQDLTKIVTRLFEHFPAMEKINAMWVSETRQGATILNSEKETVVLK